MNKHRITVLWQTFLLTFVLLSIGCSSHERASLNVEDAVASSDLFHLGNHTFPISTKSPEAQALFNKAMTLTYAFSHKVAEQEFRKAAELDPSSPMPWWGVALVNGPHINFPLVPEDKAKVAWEALERAVALRGNGNELEQSLIDALTKRYVKNQPKDRSGLDKAYAAAMKKVWAKFPSNADVGTLYAEALMDLHPWDMADQKGNLKPWAPEIINTIERAIALNKYHPGAHHLYIHAVEASNKPEKGVPSADILQTLVPGSGHLVHMPAHIYIRVGRWEDAARSNENAIRADAEFRKTNPRPGFYAIYMLHNNHFLSFVRMMQGQKAPALKAARQMIAEIPDDFMQEFGAIADGYLATVVKVQMRFGDWEAILAEPEPAENFPMARAMWRFTRATALTALDKVSEAKKERKLFLDYVKKVSNDATFGNNSAHTLLKIAGLIIDGEIAAKEKRYDSAIKLLKDAVRIEDTLTYDEPPDWIIPVRHTLGAVMVKAGRGKEAEKVYREDLTKFPGNGWSLYGLGKALSLQKRDREAAKIMEEFKVAWKGADTQITSSCKCQSE